MTDFSIEAEAPLSLDHILGALRPILEAPGIGEIWVGETETLIGYLVMSWGWGIESGGKEALIDEIYVVPKNRGYGIASDLLAAALKSAREQETKTVFLETEKSNPRSRLLYEKFNFEVEDSIWMRLEL